MSVNLMEPISLRLKTIYHKDELWINCYKDVAIKMSSLKDNLRRFFHDKNDKEILQTVSKWSEEDIKEALECSTYNN